MKGQTFVIAFIAAVAGLIGGFLFASSINRNEIATLRSENEQLKNEGSGNTATPESQSSLSNEELTAAIQKADGDQTNFEVQRSVGSAIYRYGAMKQDPVLLERSIKILERAAALRPDDFVVVLTLGNANFDVGYFAKNNDALARARGYYAKALAARPNDVGVITDVGLTYYLQTPPDLDRSIAEFRKALEKDPNHEKSLQYMVETLIKQKKTAEATEYLQKLRTVNPGNRSIGEYTSLLNNTVPAQ